MNKYLIISLIAAIVLVVFAIQNAGEATIILWFWQFKGSQALIILISVILGILFSYFFSYPALRKKNKIISAKNDEIKKLNEQIKNLLKKDTVTDSSKTV
jgi:uncharacterized integral membrane protein